MYHNSHIPDNQKQLPNPQNGCNCSYGCPWLGTRNAVPAPQRVPYCYTNNIHNQRYHKNIEFIFSVDRLDQHVCVGMHIHVKESIQVRTVDAVSRVTRTTVVVWRSESRSIEKSTDGAISNQETIGSGQQAHNRGVKVTKYRFQCIRLEFFTLLVESSSGSHGRAQPPEIKHFNHR